VKPHSTSFAIALLAGLATGCQTAKITSASADSFSSRVTKSDSILVKPFDASRAQFKGKFADVSVLADADRRRISEIICAAMIHRLREKGYQARPFDTNATADAIVVEGAVLEVDKGSYAKRLMIGLGSGSASIKADVVIRRGLHAEPMARLQMAGTGGITGGMWANEDWIGIYSASVGFKAADYLMGKAAK